MLLLRDGSNGGPLCQLALRQSGGLACEPPDHWAIVTTVVVRRLGAVGSYARKVAYIGESLRKVRDSVLDSRRRRMRKSRWLKLQSDSPSQTKKCEADLINLNSRILEKTLGETFGGNQQRDKPDEYVEFLV